MTRPGRKLVIVSAIFASVLLVSFVPGLGALNDSLLSYVETIWWAVLLGLVVGGVIDQFVPRAFIVNLLGRRRGSTIFVAAIAGLLMSACSHGILAIAIQLYRKGASIPAVITFLMASPWANLPMTFLLFGFFGLKAALIVVGAMLIAVVTGFGFMVLERYGLIEASLDAPDGDATAAPSFRDRDAGELLAGVLSSTISLANMVLWWVMIGVLIAAAIGAWVPQHWFMQYLGGDLPGMLVTLLFATVIEVCSEGSSPLAFEIYRQVGLLGNPFIFLMAGVATDFTEIGLLWSNIGRRTALWLPVIAVPQVLVLGAIFNLL